MDLSRVRELRLAHPFRQFYLLLADGRRLLIDMPYQLGVATDGSHMIVSSQGGKVEHLLPEQVRDVDVLQQKAG
jgi:hypothetical protein